MCARNRLPRKQAAAHEPKRAGCAEPCDHLTAGKEMSHGRLQVSLALSPFEHPDGKRAGVEACREIEFRSMPIAVTLRLLGRGSVPSAGSGPPVW